MKVQRISDYGTSVPWVARTTIQGIDILQYCLVSDETRLAANAALLKMHQRLAPLQAAKDDLESKVSMAHTVYKDAGKKFDWSKPGEVPSVPNLESLAEGFLQSAKIAVSTTTEVVTAFYGKRFDHKFNKLVDWATTEFGSDDIFTQNAGNCEKFVKQLLVMRDAIEHPASGRFFVKNIQIAEHEGRWLFRLPTWGVEGRSESDILDGMGTIIERVTEISEILVIELFFKHKPSVPMHVEEIPIDKRDPTCPIRFVAVPDFQIPSADEDR